MLNSFSRIAVIIPAFNEEQAIADVVHQIQQVAIREHLQLTVVVVNDCSRDNTASIIDALPCVSLHLPVNLGIGGAVQTGFRYAFRNGYDYAVQVDGDGQHPAEAIPALLKAIEQQEADVLIGSRFIAKTGFQSSFMRRLGIRFFSHLNYLLTGIRVADSTSGFRMLNRKALAVVDDYYPDEYPEPEAIILYAFNNLKVAEHPVEMLERQGGVSSINSLNSLDYMFKVSIAILFTYIRIRRKK